MSTLFDTNTSDVLFGTTNLASNVLRTVLLWAKFTVVGAGTSRVLTMLNDAGPTHSQKIEWAAANHLFLNQDSITGTQFGTDPTLTNWTCYAMTATAAGANSLIGYFRENGAGSFTTLPVTGIASFTASSITVGQIANATAAAEFAFFREWDAVLTPTELNAEFASATVVRTANLRRNLPMTNAASAGTDISGNGFNLTISGSLTDGASLPTFPAATAAAQNYYRMWM